MKRFLLPMIALMAISAFSWTAYQNNPSGMLDNPSYLGWQNEGEFFLWGGNGTDYNVKDDHGLFMNLNGLGFGYSNSFDNKDWYLGLGAGGENFHIGYLYNWNIIDDKTYKKWDIGVMYHLMNIASFGYSYHNDIDDSRSFNSFGIALRPQNWRITAFGELRFANNIDDADQLEYLAGAELHLVKGIRAYGSYNIDTEDFQIGARVDMPNLGIGAEAPTGNDNEDFEQYRAFMHSSTRRFRSLFPGGPKQIFKLDIGGEITERQKFDFLGIAKGRPLIDIIEDIQYASDSDEIEKLLIYWNNPSLNMAQATELRNAIVESGLETYIYAHNLSNIGYYITSSADQIMMAPTGNIGIMGLGTNIMFFGGALDKIGAKMEVVKSGKYKDTGIFSDTTMSGPVREEYDALFDGLHNDFIEKIAERIGNKEEAQEIVDSGPYTSEDAAELGLIDTIIFKDEVDKYVEGSKINRFALEMYKPRNENLGPEGRVAVIQAEGGIVSGNGGGRGLFTSTTVGSNDIKRAVKNALANPTTKAVVLRVESPGGSAQASEEMYHYLQDIKEDDIPLIVSMGSVAASGGYYIAAAGEYIFADPTTITGSIGVIAMKPSINGLLDKLGINTITIKRGENATMYALADTFSAKQREKLQDMMDQTYMTFKSRVAEGRNMQISDVEEIAQGRVWVGKDAQEKGLVDSLGSLTDAINYAAKEANLKDFTVKMINPDGFGRVLFNGISARVQKTPEILGQKLELPVFPYQKAEPLYLLPVKVDIE